MSKKLLPPPPPPKVDEQKKEDEYVESQIDISIDQMLAHVLHPAMTATGQDLAAAFTMLIALAQRKGATGEAFLGILDDCIAGLSLIEGLKSEMRLLKSLNLPLSDENKDALLTAAQLSSKSIQSARAGLYEKFQLLRQCKQPGVTVH
jgi:hypothetical protein